ncbi:MAG TPA: hypothetical protein VII46_04225, partial [Acidimicrobiales bacterium]
MITLVLIGFLGGLVTGISPCILPVVPVIFAAGATSGLEDDPTGIDASGPADRADADDQEAGPSTTPEAAPVAVGAGSIGLAVPPSGPAGPGTRVVAPPAAQPTSPRA